MIAGGCKLCGGTAGDSRQLAHALCVALTEQGMPTPSMGDECPCCNGMGCHVRSLVGPVNPNQDAMERWSPACVTCSGTGAVNVVSDVAKSAHASRRPKLHWYERCTPLAEVK